MQTKLMVESFYRVYDALSLIRLRHVLSRRDLIDAYEHAMRVYDCAIIVVGDDVGGFFTLSLIYKQSRRLITSVSFASESYK